MELEELNKTQIVLLTLLISFVTSIATGIVTVTLLDQAPQGVTRTINRVVERTIERVVPAENSGKEIIEREITIVVKEDDLISESIEQNSRNVVRLHRVIRNIGGLVFDDDGFLSLGTFVGIGIVATAEGLIFIDSALMADNDNKDIIVRLSTGERLLGIVVDKSEENSFTLVQVPLPEDGSIHLRPATFTTDGSLKLGQTVISLSGEERTSVSIGIISSLIISDESEEGETKLDTIVTNITTRVLVGSPLINIFGEVIGVKITGNATGSFSPVSTLRVQISKYKSSLIPSTEEEIE